MKKIALLSLLALFSVGTWAEQQTVTLDVPSMNCVTCPFTMKRALKNVEGVSNADVTLATRQVVVTFDDDKTSVEQLIESTTNAGYPSSLKK